MNAAILIHKEKDRFEGHLKRSGLKLTLGRTLVFDEVMRAHGHFAPEELVKRCRRHKKRVSRATIYRSLQNLLEAGIVRRTAFGEKHQHYEHIYDEKPHHHAKCLRCGRFIEFPDMGEDTVYKPFLEKEGFKILGHEMHFYGICKACINK
ncbi:MAG TPA: Fur family transcriptional regulator [Candidatus Omnitrophota bacterium]|nr:Fur family transcriptional regulator [Candidatus Omnitrophota bacterium]